MIKKSAFLITVVAIILSFANFVFAAENSVKIYKDGIAQNTYTNYIIYPDNNGVPYVRFDPILNDMGYEVTRFGNVLNYKIDEFCIFSIMEGSSVISTTFNYSDGKTHALYNNFNPDANQVSTVPQNYDKYEVKIIDGHFYVPAYVIMNALAYSFSEWDDSNKTLTINEYKAFFDTDSQKADPNVITSMGNKIIINRDGIFNKEISDSLREINGIWYVNYNILSTELGYEGIDYVQDSQLYDYLKISGKMNGNTANFRIDNKYIFSIEKNNSIASKMINEADGPQIEYVSFSPNISSPITNVSELVQDDKYAVQYIDENYFVPAETVDRILAYSDIIWDKDNKVLIVNENRSAYGVDALPKEVNYTATAVPSTTKFIFENKQIYLKAYNINGKNYINIDDLLGHLTYSVANSVENIAYNNAVAEKNWYKMCSTRGDTRADERFYYENGKAFIDLEGYKINDVLFYLNLKDLCALFDLSYNYDAVTNTVEIIS